MKQEVDLNNDLNKDNENTIENKEFPNELEELKKDFKKTLIYGTERVIKFLRQGKISKVYLASNTPENIKSDIKYYSKLSNFKIVTLSLLNDELGVFCKKQFSVSVIGVEK